MIGRTSILAVVGLASLAAAPAANANIFRDLDVAIRVGNPAPQRVWVEPAYETRCDRVWVEPVYDTRCERVWREATFAEQQVQVYVPDRFETRCERYRDACGRPVTREVRVLVERGHYETQCQRVCVRDGYWDNVEQRVCVTAGGWNNVERRVVVREGYWQDVCEPRRGPEVRVEVRGDDRRDYRPARDDRYEPRRDDRRERDDRRGRDDDRRYDRGDRYASR